jgi:hypothetical protein
MAAKKTGAKRLADLAGAPPRLATAEDLEAAGPATGRTHAKRVSSKQPGRINLKAVADALIEEGLDPAVELTRILKGEPMFDDAGNPVLHPITGEHQRAYLVDADTRVRTLNEMLQYTQPKLKAVEVKVSGSLELTNDQLDARLSALISKAQGKKR